VKIFDTAGINEDFSSLPDGKKNQVGTKMDAPGTACSRNHISALQRRSRAILLSCILRGTLLSSYRTGSFLVRGKFDTTVQDSLAQLKEASRRKNVVIEYSCHHDVWSIQILDNYSCGTTFRISMRESNLH
jgi:hypothetical protein